MKSLALFALFLAAAVGFAAERPKAPPGFHWKEFKDAYCAIQVPDGWFEARRTAGITHAVFLSPDKIAEGNGIDTGFTMNAVKCHTQEEWKGAMELAGKMMSDFRTATAHPVASRVKDTGDMLFMVVEGERLIPNSPHPKKMYHVRAIVHAFPKFATIYMYSFGAPADQWREAWSKGSVMLSPIWFTLDK